MKQNVKDKLTNICGIVLLVCGSVLATATAGVALPVAVVTYATVGATVSGSIIAYLTGKNPNGTSKSANVIDELNKK